MKNIHIFNIFANMIPFLFPISYYRICLSKISKHTLIKKLQSSERNIKNKILNYQRKYFYQFKKNSNMKVTKNIYFYS